jgi:hypothetical protein
MMSEFQHPAILDWFDRRTLGPSNPRPFTVDARLPADLKRDKGPAPKRMPSCPERTNDHRRDVSVRLDEPAAGRFDQEVIERPPMAGAMKGP